MILNVQDQQQVKIKADSYDALLAEKSQQQLKQIFSRYTKVKQLALDLEYMPKYDYDNNFVNQMLKDLLLKFNRFDVIIDIRIKNYLSLHYDGTLISQSFKLNQKSILGRNSNIINNGQSQYDLNSADKANLLENHIIYIDYIGKRLDIQIIQNKIFAINTFKFTE